MQQQAGAINYSIYRSNPSPSRTDSAAQPTGVSTIVRAGGDTPSFAPLEDVRKKQHRLPARSLPCSAAVSLLCLCLVSRGARSLRGAARAPTASESCRAHGRTAPRPSGCCPPRRSPLLP
jgi:hypothetical protein